MENINNDAHLFICNSCEYKNSSGVEITTSDIKSFRKKIKEMCSQLFPDKKIQVTNSGCLGRCDNAINAVIYPQGLILNGLKVDQEHDLIDHIKKCLK